MRNPGKLSLIVAVGLLTPAAALAHPGPHRGDAAWALRHVLSNSDHLLLIGVGAAIALGSAALLALQSQR